MNPGYALRSHCFEANYGNNRNRVTRAGKVNLHRQRVGNVAEEIDFGVYCPAICHTKLSALDKATGHLDPLKLTVNINAAPGKKINRNKTLTLMPPPHPVTEVLLDGKGKAVLTVGVKTAHKDELEIHTIRPHKLETCTPTDVLLIYLIGEKPY